MYYYVLNPAAGKGAINTIQQKLRERLAELGIGGEFAKTTGQGDATRMVAAAIDKGYNTIVAVGGDGTVNEVINGVTQENVAVGIIPMGTNNTMAGHFGIHNWQQAAAVLAARRISTYNLMAAGKYYFLSTLSLGFETDLDKTVEAPDTGWASRAKHLGQSWNQARSFETLQCHLELDHLSIDCNVFSLTVSNQKFQNPLLDNRMAINIAEEPSKRQLGSLLMSRFRGQTMQEEHATSRFYGTKVMIDTKPTGSIMVDGKVIGRTPMAVRLTDRKIRFITEKVATGISGLEH